MPLSASRVPVLMYHRVEEKPDPSDAHYCVGAKRFAQHLQALANAGMHACTMEAFLAWRAGVEELPEKSLLITFDDGFAGLARHAAPVLRELRWPATVFVITRHAIEGTRWSASTARQCPHALLNAADLAKLAADGFSIQSHSRSHPDLTMLSDGELEGELAGSRLDLAEIIGTPASCVAYPFGRFDKRVAAAAKRAGYRAAFTTESGFNRAGDDALRIRRLDIRGTDSPSAVRRKVELGTNDGSLGGFLGYQAKRLFARLDA